MVEFYIEIAERNNIEVDLTNPAEAIMFITSNMPKYNL